MEQGVLIEKDTVPAAEIIRPSNNISVYGNQEISTKKQVSQKRNDSISLSEYFDREDDDDTRSHTSRRSTSRRVPLTRGREIEPGGDLFDVEDQHHHHHHSSTSTKQQQQRHHHHQDIQDSNVERISSLLESTRKMGQRNYRLPYEMTNEIMKNKIKSMKLYDKVTGDLRRGAIERDIKRRRALFYVREKDRERSRITNDVISKVDECYIGDTVQHIEKMTCYIQPEITYQKGVLTILPHRLVPKNKPAVECFGSYDKYHQGFDVLPQKKLSGDTENVFLVRVRICDVKNNTGYAIGIKLAKGAKTERSTAHGVLYDLTSLKNEQHLHSGTGDRYHYISRPGENGRCENKEIIYKSDPSVNSAFSMRYPEITAKRSDYTMDGKLLSYGEFFKVEKLSPVIHLIYELKPFYPQWEYPREFKSVSGKPDNTAVLVNKSQFYEALERVIEQVQTNTTITDLSDLIFSFNVIEPDHGLEKDIYSLYTTKEKKDQIIIDPTRIRNDIVPFCFTVEFTYYFREISGNDRDKVEDIIHTYATKMSLNDHKEDEGEDEGEEGVEEQEEEGDDDSEGDDDDDEEEEGDIKKKKKKDDTSDTSSYYSYDVEEEEEGEEEEEEEEEEEIKKKKKKKMKDKKKKKEKRRG